MTPDEIAAWANLAGSITGPGLLVLAIIGILRGDVVTRSHHEEVKRLYEERLLRAIKNNKHEPS